MPLECSPHPERSRRIWSQSQSQACRRVSYLHDEARRLRRRRLRLQRHLRHETGGVVGDEKRRRVGHRFEQLLDPCRLLGREILQHIGQHELLGAGMADADAHAPVIVGEERIDRAQPVMPGGAAAALDPQLALGEIELVMDDRDLAGSELEEARRGADRFAGIVHEGLRLQHHDAFAADRPFRELALEAILEGGKGMAADDLVHRHEADIVPGARIAGPGIAEPDDEAHQLFRLPPPPAFGPAPPPALGAPPAAPASAAAAAPGPPPPPPPPGAAAGAPSMTPASAAAAAAAAAPAAAARSSRTPLRAPRRTM